MLLCLCGVLIPLQLSLVEVETAECISAAISKFDAIARSRDFDILTIEADGASTFGKLIPELQSLSLVVQQLVWTGRTHSDSGANEPDDQEARTSSHK